MKQFFGFGGYGEPQGFLSWQHILFVSIVMSAMVILAITLGLYYRKKEYKEKNKVLIWAAILINSFELVKIVIGCIRAEDLRGCLIQLPLFLCSMQLFAIPVAAFSKGKVRDVAIDFVFLFGLLGGIMGTIGHAANYSVYPVLSFPNVVSAATHSISGFASIYLGFANMQSMKKENISRMLVVLFGFCTMAYTVNVLIDYNFMFLMAGDGTPYDILYNMVNGSRVLYPVLVVGLFVLYIFVFYNVYFEIQRMVEKRHKTKNNVDGEAELLSQN